MTITNVARILHYAFLSAIADWRAMYSWQTWTFGWLIRILCQVAYFALIGRLIGTTNTVVFLVIGNSVFMVAQSVLLTISSTSWERLTGTYPLLVAAPAALFIVFAGRSVQWIADGAACASIALFSIAALFGIHLPMPAALVAVPLMLITAASAYGFGLAIGALILRAMQLRILAANISLFFLMLFTGAEVPESFWPHPLAAAINVLPITHGLLGIRALLAGGSYPVVLEQTLAEIAVGIGWLAVSGIIFTVMAARGRVDGSIEFGA